MKRDTPNILFVNPWIHDFAAYDFWAQPMGLLILTAILRQHGFTVSYLDCLDRFHPNAPQAGPNIRYGRGPYLKEQLPKPKGLEDVPKNFSRYGVRPDWFRADLLSKAKPDLIFVTSLMTYWYPGVQEAIGIIKDTYPDIPLILGGIYATLCHDHAVLHSGADRVAAGLGEKYILKLAADYTGFSAKIKFDPDNLDTYPYPAFDLQSKITYIPLRTSIGCPFSCSYCASHFLNPTRTRRSPGSVVEEIRYWHEKHGIIDFVFYDDAFLMDPEKHAIPILEGIIKAGLKVCFHTPNAIHVREISRKTANLMFKAGFKTVRLGLETATSGKRKELDSKVTANEFKQAVKFLKSAGFHKRQVGAYLLVGLPDQTSDSIENSIKTVRQTGITPVPAYYSPIPQTALWERAVASSRYDLESDPVFTNNSIFPCWDESFSWKTITYLKKLAAAHI